MYQDDKDDKEKSKQHWFTFKMNIGKTIKDEGKGAESKQSTLVPSFIVDLYRFYVTTSSTFCPIKVNYIQFWP